LGSGIPLRHADTVDVKFVAWSPAGPDSKQDPEPKQEKVIALSHPDLLALSAKTGHPLTDAWCLKLAAVHLKYMIESGEDLEKTLVTLPPADLDRAAGIPQPV